MADRTIKPDDTNDLVLQNNDGSAKIEVNEAQTVVLTGGSTTALTIDTDGDVNLTQDIYLGSGKGIYFDGGTTSANYLGGSDAYEEGSWTITLTNGTPVAGSAVAKYIKIGKQVTVYGQFQIDSGSSSGCIINNLPFRADPNISNNENTVVGAVRLYNVNIDNATLGGVFSIVYSGGYDLAFLSNTDSSSNPAIPATASGYFGFNHTYEVA